MLCKSIRLYKAQSDLENENFMQQSTQQISILASIFLFLPALLYHWSPFCSVLFRRLFLAMWWISSASHLQLDFFFGAGFQFDFTLLLFIGVCGAFFHRLKCGDFHTRLKTSFRKNLKYGENETNGIFTIDNTAGRSWRHKHYYTLVKPALAFN